MGDTTTLTSRLGGPVPKHALNLELLGNARQSVIDFSDAFTAAITVQAQVRAWTEGADHVLVKHVEEAFEVIVPRRESRRGRRLRESLKIIGSTLFGTAISGFMSALPKSVLSQEGRSIQIPADTLSLTLYAVLGIVGVLLVVGGMYGGIESQ